MRAKTKPKKRAAGQRVGKRNGSTARNGKRSEWARKVDQFVQDQQLIRVSIPKPGITDPDAGYFSEYVLSADRADEADIAILGFPIDIGASYRLVPGIRPAGGSPAEGTLGIRKGLSFCRTYCFPMDIDLKTDVKVADVGNILIGNTDGYKEAFSKFEKVYREVLKLGVTPIVLGGDNSTSYITFKTFAEYQNGKVGLIWLDAHTDTLDNYRGDRYCCGSPVARILELPSKYVDPRNIAMLGIRGFDHSARMVRRALDAGVRIYPADLVEERGIVPVVEEILDIVQDGTKTYYVMCDLDVMEAAFIPGHAIPTTGGLLPHQLKKLIRLAGLTGAGGIEFVEVAAGLDVRDMTIRLTSELVLEFISAYARGRMSSIRGTPAAVQALRKYMEVRANW